VSTGIDGAAVSDRASTILAEAIATAALLYAAVHLHANTAYAPYNTVTGKFVDQGEAKKK
jgi:hypothetical protein